MNFARVLLYPWIPSSHLPRDLLPWEFPVLLCLFEDTFCYRAPIKIGEIFFFGGGEKKKKKNHFTSPRCVSPHNSWKFEVFSPLFYKQSLPEIPADSTGNSSQECCEALKNAGIFRVFVISPAIQRVKCLKLLAIGKFHFLPRNSREWELILNPALGTSWSCFILVLFFFFSPNEKIPTSLTTMESSGSWNSVNKEK